MGAFLVDYPPVRSQFYRRRNRPLTGCTVLHTAESALDAIGPDTGAEAVASWIRRRTTPGSYHDLADSDSYVHLVPYESGAFHDGTGSNNWALSLSFACGTHHWRQMTAAQRAGFMRQGARAFAAQQAWRKANGAPYTRLRRITKVQSDAGESGFCYHGDRDPARRKDPGKDAPNLFPLDEFLSACRAALAGTDHPDAPKKDEDEVTDADIQKIVQALRNADFSPAEGTQSLQNLISQIHTILKGAEVIGAAMPTLQGIEAKLDRLLAQQQPPAA